VKKGGVLGASNLEVAKRKRRSRGTGTLGVLLELGLAGITERLIELELLELVELLELGLPETTVRLGMGVVDVRVNVGVGASVGVGVGVGGFSEIVGSALDFFSHKIASLGIAYCSAINAIASC